jgi:Ca2+-binding RTX toxin-like protein
MRKRVVLLLVAMMAAALFGVSGVAYALTIQCDGTGDQDSDPGECAGTEDPDTITGTSGDDFILAYGGIDSVKGLAGNDLVDGYGGNDVIYGGPDSDGDTGDPSNPFSDLNLEGAEDSDVVYGGKGDDVIDAASNDNPDESAGPTVDRSIGGTGNDQINAADGNVDKINCGKGGRDLVVMDPTEGDTQRSCESVVVE